MSKRRRERLRPEPEDAETLARAVNAEPWEPLPGMVKRRCLRCGYFFAVRAEESEATGSCPDCAPAQPRIPASSSRGG
jgi:hypothetical protein